MQEHDMNHDPAEALRLYVIVRADIPVGYQMAQACHAAAAIGAEQPENLRRFPTIVILNADGLPSLASFRMMAGIRQYPGCEPVPFFEPDLDDEMTAFAVFSSGELFSDLPLAGSTGLQSEVFVGSA